MINETAPSPWMKKSLNDYLAWQAAAGNTMAGELLELLQLRDTQVWTERQFDEFAEDHPGDFRPLTPVERESGVGDISSLFVGFENWHADQVRPPVRPGGRPVSRNHARAAAGVPSLNKEK